MAIRQLMHATGQATTGTPQHDRYIILLVNPISGGKKKEAAIRLVEQVFAANGLRYSIIPTNANGEYDQLKNSIAANGITDVVIMGGDGTVNQAVHALKDQPVQFGIIPFGSGNGFAFAAGIPKNLTRAIEVILRNKTKAVDAFLVNDRFSCMLTGLGFDAKVAHDFASRPSRGLLTYVKETVKNFFAAKPCRFEIEIEETSFFTEAFFISVANGNQFGNNVTIAPLARLDDGLLDVVIVQKMNKLRLPLAVIQQMWSTNHLQRFVQHMSKGNVLYFQTPRLRIRNPELALLHIDGEPVPTYETIDFTILRNCFRLLQP